MNAQQRRIYLGNVYLFTLSGLPSATWRRTRASGASPGTAATIAQVSGIAIRFCPNNRVVEQPTLPHAPIFTAPYWGLSAIDVDVQSGDIYDTGTVALLITGAPDRSQGFLVIPATLTEVPATVGGSQAGYRSPLFTLGIGAA